MCTCLNTYHRFNEKGMLNETQVVCLCTGDFRADWLGMRCAKFPGQGSYTHAHPHENSEADVHPRAISNQHGSGDLNSYSNRYAPSHRYARAGNRHICAADPHP